jgi:protein phosphatase
VAPRASRASAAKQAAAPAAAPAAKEPPVARKAAPAASLANDRSVDAPATRRTEAAPAVGDDRPSDVPSTEEPPTTRLPPLTASAFDDVPNLSFEEDEDVEPTRFTRREDVKVQPPINKIVVDEGADATPARDGSPLLVVYATAQTDAGKRRKQNEDSFLVLDDHGVFAVADGMGGHRGGQRASKLAVDTLRDAFRDQCFDADPHPELPAAASELARAIQMSNMAILDEADRKKELTGMGTTICAVRFTIDNRRLYVGHVGDSRLYRLREGMLRQLTTDHTMADYGVKGPEAAQLSRALGMFPSMPIDVLFVAPRLGDTYLLCSDGLTKMLADETIATQLLHEEDPKAAVARLVMFANAHGGKDNITAVLLRVVEVGWRPPA